MNSLTARLASIHTLTFDCYGTLIDWDRGLRLAFTEAFGPLPEPKLQCVFDAYLDVEMRIEAGPYQPYRQVVSAGVSAVAEKLGLPCDQSAAMHVGGGVGSWPPFADTGDALKRLATRFRLGILSNVDRDLVAGTLPQFPVTFDFVITAQDVRAYKPDDAHFQACLRRLGGTAGWLHVAQSVYHDGVPTAALNVPFVWINRRNEANETTARPVAVFPDMAAFASAAME